MFIETTIMDIMKIRYITTLNINPGDNFIKLGIKNLVDEIDNSYSFDELNKHKPFLNTSKFNVYGSYKLNWRISKYLFQFVNLISFNMAKEKSVYIHCGMPFFIILKIFYLM